MERIFTWENLSTYRLLSCRDCTCPQFYRKCFMIGRRWREIRRRLPDPRKVVDSSCGIISLHKLRVTVLGGNVSSGKNILCILQINQSFFLLIKSIESCEQIPQRMSLLLLNLYRFLWRQHRRFCLFLLLWLTISFLIDLCCKEAIICLTHW